MESQRVRQDWATEHTYIRNKTYHFMHFYLDFQNNCFDERKKNYMTKWSILYSRLRNHVFIIQNISLPINLSLSPRIIDIWPENFIIDLFAVDTNRENTFSELIEIVNLPTLPLDISTILWILMLLLGLILLF